MDSEFLDLDIDVQQVNNQIRRLLQGKGASQSVSDVIEEGLVTVQALKLVASEKKNPYVKDYAMQLEDLFAQVKADESEQSIEAIVPRFDALARDFQYSWSLIQSFQSREQSQENTYMWSDVIEKQHQMDLCLVESDFEGPAWQKKSQDISVHHVFESYRPWLKRAAKNVDKQIDIDVDVSGDVVIPSSQCHRVQMMLAHLLRNALTHGIEFPSFRKESGKPTVGRIKLEAYTEDEECVIVVSDDGQGLGPVSDEGLPSPRSQLFNEPVGSESQAIETSVYAVANGSTGLGVGLPIVTKCVAELGGEFSLDSSPNEYTKAVIRLPILGG